MSIQKELNPLCTTFWQMSRNNTCGSFSIFARDFPFGSLPLIFQISRRTKKGLVVEISFDLIYILPYYFYLVHVIYYFYLTKINRFISIPYPNHVYDKQRKNHFSVVICVCCAMSCSEIFFSQDGIFQCSIGSTKKKIVANHAGNLW